LLIADAKTLEVFELAVEITEGGSLCDVKMQGRAGELAGGGSGLANGMKADWKREVGWQGSKEAVEALVHSAHALEAGNGLLADIAAFVKVDGGVFEAGFLRQGVFGDFEPPCGLVVDDAEESELRGRGGGEVRGFFGDIETGQARAVDVEGSGGWLDAKDVVERRRHGHGLEEGVIRYEIALEACVDYVGEGFVALDEEIVSIAPDLHEGAEFSFGCEKAGGACDERLEAGDIDAHLAIQVACGVGAAELEAGAAMDFEKT
jgi:hypothetical protein